MIQLQRQTGKSHRANFFTTLIYRNTDGIAVSGFMDQWIISLFGTANIRHRADQYPGWVADDTSQRRRARPELRFTAAALGLKLRAKYFRHILLKLSLHPSCSAECSFKYGVKQKWPPSAEAPRENRVVKYPISLQRLESNLLSGNKEPSECMQENEYNSQ